MTRFAEVLFRLVRGRLIGGRRIAERDHRFDAVIVNDALKAVERQLAAAVEHAVRNHVEVAIGLMPPGGVGPGHSDQDAQNDPGKREAKIAWHMANPFGQYFANLRGIVTGRWEMKRGVG